MTFSPTFLAELNSLVDLPMLVGQYVPDLKKTSGDTHSACCPFHEEKTASFTVSARKGFYHCFGCGAHGDGIKFLREKRGLSFPDAVKELADMVGLQLPKQDRPEKTQQEKVEAVRFMKACEALEGAQLIYVKCLNENVEAQNYLLERGVTHSSIERYGLGYAPNEWGTITNQKAAGFGKEALEDAGLSTRSEKNKDRTYDRFRDRIMFPIYGRKERIIGFGARAIHEQEPKYLNSPESIVFSKGVNLYGLKQAMEFIQKEGRVFVFEGYMDVVMVAQHGVYNVVASLGTSITEGQMKRLFSLCGHVTFCMDGDKGGRKAAWRAAENILSLLDDKHKVDFMFMPDGMDPDDFARAHGKEGFDRAAAVARTLTDFILDTFMRYTDLKNGESMAKYLTKANEMADKIQDGAIRLSFQKRIAELGGISLDTMLQMLKEDKERKAQKAAKTFTVESVPVASAAAPAALAANQAPVVIQSPISAHHGSEISVAAKLLGIALLKDKTVAQKIEPDYLSKFLTFSDKEMLLPLIAYLKANPAATDESVLSTLAFNPHAKLIGSLFLSSQLVGEGFDGKMEAKAVIDGFRKMERVWQIVNASKAEAKVLAAA